MYLNVFHRHTAKKARTSNVVPKVYVVQFLFVNSVKSLYSFLTHAMKNNFTRIKIIFFDKMLYSLLYSRAI